jgi:GNAT superfamily N-acetyltransferase
MKGQGGGGTAKGGGKYRSGGGSVTIKKSKTMQTKAIDGNVVKLRAALFDEQGKDKDVTGGIAKSFLCFERDGVCVDICFSAKLSSREVNWAFDLVKENMEAVYDDSGYGWDDDDKERELSEQGARFLLLKDRETHKLIGFVHFRFTVQGEVIDQMVGSPCIYVLDIHIEESFQKKGLGRHLLIILELIARREQMTRVSLPVFLQHPEMKEWLTTKCKGYAKDLSYIEIGFDSDAEVGIYKKL